MAYTDLRDFVRALEQRGELKRIPFEVDSVLEITEFADRSVKHGGPALLFEKPKGSTIPVLIKQTFTPWLQLQVGSNGYTWVGAATHAQFLELVPPCSCLCHNQRLIITAPHRRR